MCTMFHNKIFIEKLHLLPLSRCVMGVVAYVNLELTKLIAMLLRFSVKYL